MQKDDVYFIKKTFKLAKGYEGFTSPNPLVGAVIVKNNKIVSVGVHKKAGLPHAEIEAIRKFKGNFEGATLYVNLEPCFHFGRTPPCVDEIIKNKIKRVVIATLDPNPLVCGKSVEKLRRENIEVKVGVLEKEAQKINEVFFKNMKKNMPFVVAKVAQSLDGKITTYKGISKWITSSYARDLGRILRDKYDAVLVGVNTVIKDNPRLEGLKKSSFKVVLDPDFKIPTSSYLFKNKERLIIFTSLKWKEKIEKKFPSLKIIFLKEKEGLFSLKMVLKKLYRLGIASVFVEGGSFTLGKFFEEKLIDKFYFFISFKLIGGKGALTSLGAKGFAYLKNCPYLKNIEIKRLKKELLISGYPDYF